MELLIEGDCLQKMKEISDNSIDAIVTDPPYGLGFMGKDWDKGVPNIHFWEEMIRVLKPGGYLLAFSGTRTYHRMATAIEDAGFEIRDMIEWVYGCLSEDTEILTINGWKRYHKDIDKSPVLCFDIDRDSFEFQKPKRSFIYENKYTAYRIESNFTDQIVSRNHRCLVERKGKLVFERSEALQCQENIPFLEGLSDLPETIYNAYEGTSVSKHDLLTRVQKCDIERQTEKTNNSLDRNYLSGLWQNISNKKKQTFKILLSKLQWSSERSGMEKICSQRESQLDTRERTGFERKHDWRQKLGLERWSNLFQKKRQVCRSENKICEMSEGISRDGEEGWICNGTQINRCQNTKQTTNQSGGGTSYQSRCDRQQNRELNAIQDECRSQEIRTRSGYKTTLATITPIEYEGSVWCVEVPTGAFVARRNGQIFITGNSGFPKSHNIGKSVNKLETKWSKKGTSEWEGWGTALKPAHEPICMARKPLAEKTVAENVLKYGTGGINIEESRVGIGDDRVDGGKSGKGAWGKMDSGYERPTNGRFPANLILSDSEEIRECFPDVKTGGSGCQYKRNLEYEASSYQMGGKGNNDIAPSSGNASRFFKSIIYQAKASKSERNEGCEGLEEKQYSHDGRDKEIENPYQRNKSVATNNHPTVKPIALMEYLVKMITPEGRTVLDPFMGSGTTGIACKKNNINFIGIELNPDYFKIAKTRLEQLKHEPHKHESPKIVQCELLIE